MDAGNALFKAPGLGAPEDKERAAFILKTMGQLGTQAMAAGARDLDFGPAWLKAQAAKANVPVLSANLVDKAQKPLFPASRVVEVDGHKVGIIGASPAGKVENGDGAQGLAPAPLVAQEAKKLRGKTDLIVVLAAIPYADALQLATLLGDQVDFIFQSHEGRGQGVAQRAQGNFVLPTGERGRQLGRLILGLNGKGAFVDASELARDRQTLQLLDTQMEQVRKRLEMTSDPASKKALEETQRQFMTRRKEVAGRVEAGSKAGGRSMGLEWINLGSEFTEDASLAAAVKKIEPNGAAH